MTRSDVNISIELGIDIMQRLGIDDSEIKEVIVNYINDNFFIN